MSTLSLPVFYELSCMHKHTLIVAFSIYFLFCSVRFIFIYSHFIFVHIFSSTSSYTSQPQFIQRRRRFHSQCKWVFFWTKKHPHRRQPAKQTSETDWKTTANNCYIHSSKNNLFSSLNNDQIYYIFRLSECLILFILFLFFFYSFAMHKNNDHQTFQAHKTNAASNNK